MKLFKNKPRWDLDEAARRAERAYGLLTGEDRATLEARGLAGAAEPFRRDLDVMAEARVSAVADLQAQKGATGGKRDAAEDGHDFVMVVRQTAERLDPLNQELKCLLGVGDRLKARQVTRVLANLDKIVELGGPHGDALAPSGITSAHIAEAAELAAALRTKKRAKENKVETRVDHTSDRRALHLRVEATVDRIGMAGIAAFRKDLPKRARYEALFASAIPAAPPVVLTGADADAAHEAEAEAEAEADAHAEAEADADADADAEHEAEHEAEADADAERRPLAEARATCEHEGHVADDGRAGRGRRCVVRGGLWAARSPGLRDRLRGAERLPRRRPAAVQ